MPQIQVGTTELPLLIRPRINKTDRTVSYIKASQSFLYISDVLTPLTFGLEYRKRGDLTPTTQAWDEAKSTDDTLFFPVPNEFYEEVVKWSLMVYWEVHKISTDEKERIYIENAIALEVKDINNI